MTPSEPQTNVAGGPLLEPHDDGCRCWPHVSQSDAFRAVEHAALIEYRSSKPVEREAQGIPLIPDTDPTECDHDLMTCNHCGITRYRSGGIPLIDVELLALALTRSLPGGPWMTKKAAKDVAAEYTRLASESSPVEEGAEPDFDEAAWLEEQARIDDSLDNTERWEADRESVVPVEEPEQPEAVK